MSSNTYRLLRREDDDCVKVEPDDRGHVPNYACNSYYPFDPSTWLALAFGILFLITTVAHVFLAFRHKAGYAAVIFVGASWEFSSFALRTYGTRNQQKKTAALVSFLLFTLAPIWINAFVYMVAGRMVTMFSPTKRVFKISATWMSRLFIIFDILAFLVQLGGASMIGPGASKARINTGLRIYQAGLGLQQAFILAFLVLLVGFHLQMSRLQASGWRDDHNRKWQLLLWIEYIALILISIRVAYRLAEYILPHENNPMIENEVYMYVLDAVPMAICLILYIVFHPGRVIKGPGSDFRQAKKQIKAEKKARKMGVKNIDGDSDDEEEHMIGVELQDRHQPTTAYGGAGLAHGPPAYGPPPQGPTHGDLAGGQNLYDPYGGVPRM